eukprot:1864752-Pyramimonas_sp.AAC.1
MFPTSQARFRLRSVCVYLGLPDRVRADGVGGSRRIAYASAVRLGVEPDFLHADGADAPLASPMHRRDIANVSA